MKSRDFGSVICVTTLLILNEGALWLTRSIFCYTALLLKAAENMCLNFLNVQPWWDHLWLSVFAIFWKYILDWWGRFLMNDRILISIWFQYHLDWRTLKIRNDLRRLVEEKAPSRTDRALSTTARKKKFKGNCSRVSIVVYGIGTDAEFLKQNKSN